ncbi:MAG: hypothetical protein EP330_25040 [Deltaproteobacteria bacterium]|nr:MAG: hypothetical protein EP330_25040 [Deltaproteobacteria bacterium]
MTRLRMALLVAALVVALALTGVVAVLSSPKTMCRLAERGLEWPEGSITAEDITLSWSGRFRIEGVRVEPPVLRMPVVYVAWAEADLPSPWFFVSKQVHLGEVEASGVEVGLRIQRPPREERVLAKRPYTLHASSLTVHDSRFHAAPDETFSEVILTGLNGQLDDVHWTPATKHVDGVGNARATRFVLGEIELDELVLPSLVLADEALALENATFQYGRTEGRADGGITDIPGDPAVELQVVVKRGRAEEAITDAIGRVSPVTGWLDAELTVRAGGELPRGESRLEGWVSLSDGYVFMGSDMKLIPKVLLDVAPWFQREDGGWLHVGDLWGEARFGRGWVEIERLERMSDRNRPLQAWGHLRDGRVDVTVRAVPRRRPEKPGVGVRLRGPLRSAKLKFARKSELMDAPEVLVVD